MGGVQKKVAEMFHDPPPSVRDSTLIVASHKLSAGHQRRGEGGSGMFYSQSRLHSTDVNQHLSTLTMDGRRACVQIDMPHYMRATIIQTSCLPTGRSSCIPDASALQGTSASVNIATFSAQKQRTRSVGPSARCPPPASSMSEGTPPPSCS